MQSEQTLYFHRGDLNFSAGHFTIFSKTKRETLHGHNYYLECAVVSTPEAPGITFDYRVLKRQLQAICDSLNTKFLLPTESPFLSLEDQGDTIVAVFDNKPLYFLKEDIVLLEVKNVTLEELSHWFLAQLTQSDFVVDHPIAELEIRVFNGATQSASAKWARQVMYA